jgi:hypothetical protein
VKVDQECSEGNGRGDPNAPYEHQSYRYARRRPNWRYVGACEWDCKTKPACCKVHGERQEQLQRVRKA